MIHNNSHASGRFLSHRGPKGLRIVGMTFAGVAFAVVFALVFGLLVKVLWNWLMPMLFSLPQITYWQAFGIVILVKLLFGGFGPHHRDRPDRVSRRFLDKWEKHFGGLNEEDWEIEGGSKNWKYYKQYWREEGKAAFENYVRKVEKQEEKQGD
jgi:hypothetical protein